MGRKLGLLGTSVTTESLMRAAVALWRAAVSYAADQHGKRNLNDHRHYAVEPYNDVNCIEAWAMQARGTIPR